MMQSEGYSSMTTSRAIVYTEHCKCKNSFNGGCNTEEGSSQLLHCLITKVPFGMPCVLVTYGWMAAIISTVPSSSNTFTTDHWLSCAYGAFLSIRHNYTVHVQYNMRNNFTVPSVPPSHLYIVSNSFTNCYHWTDYHCVTTTFSSNRDWTTLVSYQLLLMHSNLVGTSMS